MSHTEITGIKTGQLGIFRLKDCDVSTAETFPFSNNEKKEFLAIKNDRRKREYLSVRQLLREMTGKKNEIQYSPDGKPALKNQSLHISISHSADLAVVILSSKKTGIDVENKNRNIRGVAKRFLSEMEWSDVNRTPNPGLTGIIYWCAKEAAFKFSILPEIDFKKHITIRPFYPKTEGGTFAGELCKEDPAVFLSFHYLFFENNVIVYCVEEDKEGYEKYNTLNGDG